MHARPVDRRHLPALHVGDAPLRKKDEDVGARAAAERLDGRRAGVARRSAYDGRAGAALFQRGADQPPEPLHGEILERQRRAMEEFEQEQVVVDLDQRRGRGVTEAAVGCLGHGGEFAGAEVLANEGRNEARGGAGVGKAGERGDRAGRDRGDSRGRVKAAVAGKAGERGVEEAERRRLAARRDIAHVKRKSLA